MNTTTARIQISPFRDVWMMASPMAAQPAVTSRVTTPSGRPSASGGDWYSGARNPASATVRTPHTITGRPRNLHVLYGEESQTPLARFMYGKSRAAMAVGMNTEVTCMPVTMTSPSIAGRASSVSRAIRRPRYPRYSSSVISLGVR